MFVHNVIYSFNIQHKVKQCVIRKEIWKKIVVPIKHCIPNPGITQSWNHHELPIMWCCISSNKQQKNKRSSFLLSTENVLKLKRLDLLLDNFLLRSPPFRRAYFEDLNFINSGPETMKLNLYVAVEMQHAARAQFGVNTHDVAYVTGTLVTSYASHSLFSLS